MQPITLRRPKTKRLAAAGYACVDMQVHSLHSDGFHKVATILKKCRKRRFGLALTDHHTIDGVLEAWRLKDDVLVIPGIELTSKEGPDVIVYFYAVEDLQDFFQRHVSPYITQKIGRMNRPLLSLITDARKYQCLITLPHPYGWAWKNIARFLRRNYHQEILRQIDAIEVISGEVTRKKNLQAIEWRQRLGKGMTAGSDGHVLSEIGGAVTCCSEHTVAGFLDAVKQRQVIVVGKESRIAPHILANGNIMRCKLRQGRRRLWERIKKGRERKAMEVME
ncbi:PHP domain-containing protein [Candidatus Woesearchaeota archaeon]|nr:PHP domain-containing protein [Candidatus Woesearchaeota archaeon]